jgi:hypothetical protein
VTPQELSVLPIAFICEQDGNIERELKKRWADYLKADVHVTLGCLAKVRYGESSEQKVALCLRADGAERRPLVERVSSDFKKLFKTTESLDIIFLSPEHEHRLLLVVKPFYRQDAHQA